ncbi:glycosyltransferase family 2 protein [Asaia spathodeae]|uniref:glycosyltransferase family A protein n=1 Tax=Asaia spathodeae TaxID=657016 RepID=UPI002FC2CC98
MQRTGNDKQKLFPSVRRWENDGGGDSVAIIMRTKDRPILLSRAIASVLNQTHHNWILYLVNDGGDGPSFEEVVDRYKLGLTSKVKILQNEQSLGMEAASNCALSLVGESFIVVHDDDDAWHPDFLAETVAYLHKNREFAAVVTNCVVIHEIVEDNRAVELFREKWSQWKPFVDACDLLSRNISPPISMLIRSSVAQIVGKFNDSLPVLGDWDYNIRVFLTGDIGTIDKELSYYYQRPKEDSIYSNSVRAGVDKHNLYQTLYRNSLVRRHLTDDPSALGGIHLLLEKIDRAKNEIVSAIYQSHTKIEAENLEIKTKLSKIEMLMENIFQSPSTK